MKCVYEDFLISKRRIVRPYLFTMCPEKIEIKLESSQIDHADLAHVFYLQLLKAFRFFTKYRQTTAFILKKQEGKIGIN